MTDICGMNKAKLVLLGDAAAGKTSLVLRFVKDQFNDPQGSTIGAFFFVTDVLSNGVSIKLDIWDTAGQERYHCLAPMYYRNAAAAIVVYDITNHRSFENAKRWVQELQRQGSLHTFIVLVGNKADLADENRQVDYKIGEQYANQNGLHFLETSAKTAYNVNELFREIAKEIARNRESPSSNGMRLENIQPCGRRRYCCSS